MRETATRMFLFALVVAGLVWCAGCSTTGSAEIGIRRNQSPAALAMAATPKGALPASVTVTNSDGSPAPAAELRAVDGAERVTDVRADGDGRAMVAFWSEAIGSWKWLDGATWRAMPPCRFYPADGGAKGWRVACTLPNGGGQ